MNLSPKDLVENFGAFEALRRKLTNGDQGKDEPKPDDPHAAIHFDPHNQSQPQACCTHPVCPCRIGGQIVRTLSDYVFGWPR